MITKYKKKVSKDFLLCIVRYTMMNRIKNYFFLYGKA
jgi:hypothetical protein